MAAELTLAVPYYSGFALLEQTLRSLAAQPARVLIVDDSPQGFSRAELATIGRLVDARVLRNATNLGMARSWNRCLDDAETDLVTIVHADDLLAPGYAERVLALSGSGPAVFTGARVIGLDGAPVFSLPDQVKRVLVPRHSGELILEGDVGLASLLRGNYIFCPSLCFRRSRMRLRFDPRWRFALDMDLTVRLLLAGERLVGVPREPLYQYRRHADNATARLTAELTRFREESAFYGEVARAAGERGYAQSTSIAARRRIIQLNLGFCIARDLAGRRFRDGAQKLRLFRDLFVRDHVS